VGARTPPTAAITGKMAARLSASAPAVISRRISNPTRRKNIPNSPSENHAPTVKDSMRPGVPRPKEESMNRR
jgi:hypothetical protein